MGQIFILIAEKKYSKPVHPLIKSLEQVFPEEIILLYPNSKQFKLFQHNPSAFNPHLLIIIQDKENPKFGYEFLKFVLLQKPFILLSSMILNEKSSSPDTIEGFYFDADIYSKWPGQTNKIVENALLLMNNLTEIIEKEKLIQKVHLILQNKLKFLFEVDNIITKLFSDFLDDTDIINLRLTLDELGTNAIRHGNSNDPNKKISIFCRLFEDFLSIAIEDQGKGFKVEDVPDPTTKERILLPSGRGIFIAKQLMDEIYFHGRGNKVEFIKKR